MIEKIETGEACPRCDTKIAEFKYDKGRFCPSQSRIQCAYCGFGGNYSTLDYVEAKEHLIKQYRADCLDEKFKREQSFTLEKLKEFFLNMTSTDPKE
jgi:hypothetical protein